MDNKNLIIICLIIIAICLSICAGYIIYTNSLSETNIKADLTVINQGDNLTLSLMDDKGVPLTNKTIYITINNKTYNRTTNDVGLTQLPINLAPNTYYMKLEYKGDLQHKSCKTIHYLTVQTPE